MTILQRREFIAALGGSAAWPLAAGGQERKRLGVLMSRAESEPWQSQLTIFMQEMRKHEGTRQGYKAASRLAPKGSDGRFDFCVATNGRNDWLDRAAVSNEGI